MKEEDVDGLLVSGLLATERRLLRKQRIVFLVTKEIEIADASELIEDFLLLSEESKEPITIVISSPGGNHESGIACVRAIKVAQSKGIKIIGQVFGQAMSMAFFILQACDWRVMGEGCWLMAHGFRISQEADQKSRKIEDKMVSKSREYFAKLIAGRNTSKDSKYKNMNYWFDLFEDMTPNYYSAEEAMEYGLIDEIGSWDESKYNDKGGEE